MVESFQLLMMEKRNVRMFCSGIFFKYAHTKKNIQEARLPLQAHTPPGPLRHGLLSVSCSAPESRWQSGKEVAQGRQHGCWGHTVLVHALALCLDGPHFLPRLSSLSPPGRGVSPPVVVMRGLCPPARGLLMPARHVGSLPLGTTSVRRWSDLKGFGFPGAVMGWPQPG